MSRRFKIEHLVALQMRVVTFITFIWAARCRTEPSTSCGMQRQATSAVEEGTADIYSFPWLGMLLYSFGSESGHEPLTATVVLITNELALAAALDIDKFPKDNFRSRSRVVLGRNCSGPYLRVMEYIFHPEYRRQYYSALAMIQLKPTKELKAVGPICPPPKDFEDQSIYAFSLAHECSSSMVSVYSMMYVSMDECRDYYRRNDLDVESLWPKHTACAQSLQGGKCLWQSGTVLATKQRGKWHLLGVGVYGPGCEAPARFLDYNKYQEWVEKSRRQIGKVALTRMGRNHLILRRSGWRLQRWGPCDTEERQAEMFSDYTVITPQVYYRNKSEGVAKYNLSLVQSFDYTCISMRVWYTDSPDDVTETPYIDVVRYCQASVPLCAGPKNTAVNFYVVIKFVKQAAYIINIYGKETRTVDEVHIFRYLNKKVKRPRLPYEYQKELDYY